MKSRIKTSLLLCLAVLFASCKGNQSAKEEDMTIQVTQVTLNQNDGKKEFPFITQPFHSSQLSFRVGGPIERLEVYAGNYYKQGEVIAEIDNRDYRIRKERAEALYRQAKAEYERIETLYEKNNLSASTYEKAKADYTSAKTAFETASNELKDTRLIAPFNGYIGEVFVEKYQEVKASQPVITFMEIDRLKIEAYVTQDVAFKVQNGSTVSLILDVEPNKMWNAKIIEVSKGTTANNLSYLVTALLPNESKQFLAGMSGKIYFEPAPGSLQSTVCIPQKALCHRPSEGSYVWTVNTRSLQVSQRKVTLGELLPDGNVSIARGLQPNETLAVSGLRFLSDGMKVKIGTAGTTAKQ